MLQRLKSYKSEQWRSAAVIHEDRLEFYMWARWTTMSRRVFYSYSPFSRRNSMRIALVSFLDNPAFSFGFYATTTRSGLSGFRSMEIASPSSVWLCPSQMIWLPLRCSTILLCSIGSDQCLPLEPPCLLRCHLDFLRCYHADLRAYTYLIILIRTFASIVSAHLWFRSVDSLEYQLRRLLR